MKRYAAVVFIVIAVGLMVSGGCSCKKDKGKTIYIPPDTGTGTGTSSATNTNTGTSTVPTGPTIVSAVWEDADVNGIVSDFDGITVTFSEQVTGSTSIGDFSLPVSGDTFGTAPTANINTINGTVSIVLGTSPVITVPGVFSTLATSPGSPSGLTVAGGTAIVGQTSGLAAQAGTADISGGPTGVNPHVVSASLISPTRIDVTFDVEVDLNGAVSNDPNGAFQLPVSGDGFGTSPTMEESSLDPMVIIIWMGNDNVITAPGVYNPANVGPGDPSGIDILGGQLAVVSHADFLAAEPNADATDIELDTNPPALVGAYYDDVDGSKDKNAADKIILYFDREVQLVGAVDNMTATFSNVQDDVTSLWLPVTNDSLDCVDNMVLARDGTAGDNEIEITIGDNPIILVAGIYNPDYTPEGVPSGIGFGNSGLVESVMASTVALLDNAVDIEPGNLPAGFLEVTESQFGGDNGAYWQAVTLMADGQVFTAGGCFMADPYIFMHSTCCIFDPDTETWRYDLDMIANDGTDFNHSVWGAAATLLLDNCIFICGGGGIVNSAGNMGVSNYMFIYDPVADTVSQLGNRLTIPRYYHSVSTLNSGNVLIVGGVGNDQGNMFGSLAPQGSWVIVDPSDGTEISNGSLTGGVVFGGLHKCGSKHVYLGGLDSSGYTSDEIKEFDGSVWSAASPSDMGNANWLFGSAALDATTIFFSGARHIPSNPGQSWGTVYGVLWNDSGALTQSTNNFYKYASVSTRYALTGSKLPSGDAIIAGGSFDTVIYIFGEIYDRSTNEVWENPFPQIYPRRLHEAVQLSDGTVLLIGGASNMGYNATSGSIDILGTGGGFNNQAVNTSYAERFWFQ